MMMLDTNVVSEFVRERPSEEVRRWWRAQRLADAYLSAISEAELLVGLALMPDGRRKVALQQALQQLLDRTFRGRILPFDSAAAREYPRIVTARRAGGRPIKEADAQMAAIARAHAAALATRDTGDFEGCGIALIDPWAG